MLEFHDPIPDIPVQRCESLMVQEYRYRGDPVSDANVVFLRVEDGTWHRFFIDAGVVFWKAVAGPDECADDGDHHYSLKDIGAIHELVGKQLSRVSAVDLPNGCEIRLDFGDGKAVILRNVDDRSELAFLSDDSQAR
jgi:hypothetical protein